MVSERKREANRRNAQKSTGPRTEEGKARSRRNALKHGLTGSGTVLPPSDLEAFRDRMQAWSAEVEPKGQLETYLVATAVLAAVRLDRTARHEIAAIAKKRDGAIAGWEARQLARVEAMADGLEDDPGAAVEAMRACSVGCRWLLAQWRELAEAIIGEPGGWRPEQVATALRLLGKNPLESIGDDDEPGRQAAALRWNALALRPLAGTKGPGEDEREEVAAWEAIGEAAGASVERAWPEPDRDEARGALAEIVGEVLAQLEREADDLWFQTDGPALAGAIDLATIDTTHRGKLRRRYEVACNLEMHRALNQLARRRHDAEMARRRAEKAAAEAESRDRPARASGYVEPRADEAIIVPPQTVPEPPDSSDESPAQDGPSERPESPEAGARNEANAAPSTIGEPSTWVEPGGTRGPQCDATPSPPWTAWDGPHPAPGPSAMI